VTLQNLQTAMTKKGCQFFQEKIVATPSVAAPGDTNPSDATENNSGSVCHCAVNKKNHNICKLHQ